MAPQNKRGSVSLIKDDELSALLLQCDLDTLRQVKECVGHLDPFYNEKKDGPVSDVEPDEVWTDTTQLLDLGYHSNCVGQYLYTYPEVFETLRTVKTLHGGTIASCIRTGVENRHGGLNTAKEKSLGLVACDACAWDDFVVLFEPCICFFYGREEGFKDTFHTPLPIALPGLVDPTNGALTKLPNKRMDIVKGFRIELSRNIAQYAFAPIISRQSRRELEGRLKRCLAYILPPQTQYFSISRSDNITCDRKLYKRLEEANMLMTKPCAAGLCSARFNTDWPHGRGMFVLDTPDYLCAFQLNYMEHLNIVLEWKGPPKSWGDVFPVVFNWLNQLEYTLKLHFDLSFAHEKQLGYLPCLCQNVGTCMNVAVACDLNEFGVHKRHIPKVVEFLDLFPVRLDFDTALYSIVSKPVNGVDEMAQIQSLMEGVMELDLMNSMTEINRTAEIALLIQKSDEQLAIKQRNSGIDLYDSGLPKKEVVGKATKSPTSGPASSPSLEMATNPIITEDGEEGATTVAGSTTDNTPRDPAKAPSKGKYSADADTGDAVAAKPVDLDAMLNAQAGGNFEVNKMAPRLQNGKAEGLWSGNSTTTKAATQSEKVEKADRNPEGDLAAGADAYLKGGAGASQSEGAAMAGSIAKELRKEKEGAKEA